MYFITELDPNYSIKGSRDPLGFQVIWQAAGRRVIPHLSTVSASIRDFQILCIAHALKKELQISDENFEPFFMRIEQLMGYTRYLHCNDDSFNGIERVKRKAGDNKLYLSVRHDDQLMSSQKAYGIWGKYIRPFTDIAIADHPDFEQVYLQKIRTHSAIIKQARNLKNKQPDERNTIFKNDLHSFCNLLDKPTGAEKELLTQLLLQDKHQGSFYKLVQQHDGFRGGLGLFSLIDTLRTSTTNESFSAELEHIKQTEKVLSPLNRIFRYLQTRSYWNYAEIESDPFISTWRTAPDTTLLPDIKSLAGLLALSNTDLVKGLLQRNEEVVDRRHSAPWMRLTASGLEVNHIEGAMFDAHYNPETDAGNSYFLFTFIHLYQQLN
jgi:hypothetical protein